MEMPYHNWNAAIPIRTSRRRYKRRGLEADILSHIQSVCYEFRPFPQARAALVTRHIDTILNGFRGSYGFIRGATALIAFVGDARDINVQEKVGYTGEGIVLEATTMGLNTCWIAGSFRRRAASAAAGTSENERVIAVTPIGYAADTYSFGERILPTIVHARSRKTVSELTSGLDETDWPQWMKAALESARLAPSAYNRQPWRFKLEPDSITVSSINLKQDFGFSSRLDCGIAMLHIEAAVRDCGLHGQWKFLAAPDVARFTLTTET